MVPRHDDEPAGGGSSNPVQGGRERGLIIQKLLEEVVTGETADHLAALTERASELICALGQPIAEDPAPGLSPAEIAGCVVRTLALPDIVVLRPTLVPEFPIYASDLLDGLEEVTAGITDATSFAADGRLDWKSDVAPTPETVEHYRAQVGNYLRTTRAENGLIVFVTTGGRGTKRSRAPGIS
jgi:exodeoxyribonuclease-5